MTSDSAAFPIPAKVIRPRSRPAPIEVWEVALLLFIAGAAIAAAIFYFWTPLPAEADANFYRRQIALLEKQEAIYRARGEVPLSVVFIGTSRIKNATMRPKLVAQSAKAAGIQRPVASTFVAINWGGFERLGPAMDLIERAHPDAVVVMPELFLEDLKALARPKIGFRYLKSLVWGQQFNLFGDKEYYEPACSGFDTTPEYRLSLNDEWMTSGTERPGPTMARAAVQSFQAKGIEVFIADVPVTRPLASKRGDFGGPSFLADSNVKATPGLHTVWIGGNFHQRHYCDWAHFDPERAPVWQKAFFAKAAPDLNRLR